MRDSSQENNQIELAVVKKENGLELEGISMQESIVRPVKRDWAVLSKATPVDISI